jgi:predicted metal-dependent phosphotriesterase family hydrolase
MKTSRRKFIFSGVLMSAGTILLPGFLSKASGKIMTVNGLIPSEKMGFTLVHEHVMVDFIGASDASKSRYIVDDVINVASPFLKEIKERGVQTFIDCTPAYVGRDVTVLKQLADSTGMNLITTTGYYGAVKEKYVPMHAFTESAQQLANRWIGEWKNGIEGTNIRPGLIKTSTDKAPLTPVQRNLETGLTIGVHTGDGPASFEQLEILEKQGVSPMARVWFHAQSEPDQAFHIKAAKLGCWVSFDGVNPQTLLDNLGYLKTMKAQGLLHRVLVSQDSGWYNVGEPGGGNFKPYTCIINDLIPLLKRNGFTPQELDLLFRTNPQAAFSIKVRRG